MLEKPADTNAANQVTLAVRSLDSLSILPCVAAQLFARLLEAQSSTSALVEIIESDPALAVRIFSLIHEQGLGRPGDRTSLRHAVGKLSAELVRDAVFSVNVAGGPDAPAELPKKNLTLHSLAVACCAEDIAQISSLKIDPQSAYSAGLLHDIGKLALCQVMPKSFDRIVQEAQSRNLNTCALEQEHLGLDHTIIGKRLARKWHLPNPVALAVWLHHGDTIAITQTMPEAEIAQVVQLADILARQCSIGHSGSYDKTDSAQKIAQALGISSDGLDRIHRSLLDKVAKKSAILGLDLPDAHTDYCQAVHAAAVELARQQNELSTQIRRLQITSSHFDFARDFMLSIDSDDSAVDIAENFAVRWQKFYQTGMVCLYLADSPSAEFIEAVLVENLSKSSLLYLSAAPDTPTVPQAIRNNFSILNAHDCLDWLLDQLDVEFDLNQTRLLPLLARGEALGAILFELRYPQDAQLFAEKFKTTACIAAAVLDMALAGRQQRGFAEKLAQLIGKSTAAPERSAGADTEQPPLRADSLDALAEMAGGAAHELNNPLSVISGRAQLLAEAETDAEKKHTLELIRENAGEIARIIESLMTFAQPRQPRPTQISVKQLLDEATQLTARRVDADHLDIQTELDANVETVFVDSAQIVSAIANIFANALDAYTEYLGPVKVTVTTDESGNFVKLQITDFGTGMDDNTVRKAAYPFFSAKPAGRKRGMGLAHAHRLIRLNKGSLNITSTPGTGTNVTIRLPQK